MPRRAYQDRIDEVRRAEFGSRVEVAVRYGVLLSVAVVVYLVLQNALAIAWPVAHFVAEAITIVLLHMRNGWAPRLRYWGAICSYTLSGAIFASLPIYFIATDPSIAMKFAAAVGIVGLAVYTLQRRHHDTGMMVSDMIQIGAISIGLLAALFPQVPGWQDRLFMIFVIVAANGYYIGANYSSVQQNRQLRDAQQRYAHAQKARALNQFVGGVAHDFNNQLTAILGHLELFDLLDDPKERASALDQSRQAARRAALTVQQLLASSGRTRLDPSSLPVQDALHNVKSVLDDLLAPGMRVSVLPTENDLSAFVDGDMLETCLIQAALNAQDATRGRGHIRLWAEHWTSAPLVDNGPEAAAPYAVIVMEDDGPGVSKEALPMLAEPFYTTKNVGEGSGLGLSAIAGFARQSGGTLVLSNSEESGLRLAVVLPIRAEALEPDVSTVQPSTTVAAHKNSLPATELDKNRAIGPASLRNEHSVRKDKDEDPSRLVDSNIPG